jgi:hypothetical protein
MGRREGERDCGGLLEGETGKEIQRVEMCGTD